jgi:PKHD-type hydroxylase
MYIGPILNKNIRGINDITYYSKAFGPQQIELLEELVKNYEFEKGKTGIQEYGNIDTDKTNNRDIAYLFPNPDTQGLYDYLEGFVNKANEDTYNFNLSYVTDPIHYVIYPEDGGHLTWHMDIGAGHVNNRKLAMTVQLSDPDEYEGGDFQIWMGGEGDTDTESIVTLSREKGDILIFPTYLMHRVTPITKGQRKALVFWTGGEPFR